MTGQMGQTGRPNRQDTGDGPSVPSVTGQPKQMGQQLYRAQAKRDTNRNLTVVTHVVLLHV